ncbi:MAG TPA: energy transducer TonB [Methylomirabilota bacterium]|nr:energy transducer TonB [Methylomirabilota bacterium]
MAVGHDRTGREAHDDASDASPSEQGLARGSPTGEGGEALPGVYRDYLAGLRQRIHEALRYPPAARRRGLTGAVTIELTVLPSGVISDVKVVHSSSHSLLDDAAVETVQELRAQRFPPNVPARPLRVRLPVVFQLE